MNERPPLFKTREEFWRFMERHVSKTYQHIREEVKLPYKHNYLKSYLLEVNSINPFQIPEYISQIKLRQTKLFAEVHPTKDPRLFNVVITAWTKRGEKTTKKTATFYLDISPRLSRFWILHTIDKSQDADALLRYLVMKPGSRLDRPWFSSNLLIEFSKKLGELKGLGIQYRYSEILGKPHSLTNSDEEESLDTPEDPFMRDEFPYADEVLASEFTMRVWGKVSERLLKKFIRDEYLRQISALSSIGIKRERTKEDFILEDITYWGKFKTSGSSFFEHMEIIHEVEKRYLKLLSEQIESELISAEKTSFGYYTKGSPFIITLKNTELQDNPKLFKTFVERIFSGRPPFRIFGIKTKVAKDEYIIYGTDLHNGDPIELEVTPEWISIHLRSIPNQTVCGNTVLRFFTNIQRYYDPQAILESEANGKILIPTA